NPPLFKSVDRFPLVAAEVEHKHVECIAANGALPASNSILVSRVARHRMEIAAAAVWAGPKPLIVGKPLSRWPIESMADVVEEGCHAMLSDDSQHLPPRPFRSC